MNATQLVSNKHFDRLITIIQAEKEKASKIYFEKLIANHQNIQSVESVPDKMNHTQFSPIEQIFQKHMKRSLASFEQYYQLLKSKYDIQVENVKSQFTAKMTAHQMKNQKSLEIGIPDPQIMAWKKECEEKLEELEKSFKDSTSLMLQSYDDYMQNFAPAPEYLPVTLTVQVPSKSIQFPNIMISPTDTMVQVREQIIQKLAKKGDPVVSHEGVDQMVLINPSTGLEILIDKDNVPIVQYRPEPGATLVVKGNFFCNSDKPKQCFKNVFVRDAGMRMDYFTCKQCKLNWLCKSCAETCHKDHVVTEYITNHLPTWGCCYCAKSGTCKLVK